MGNLWKTSQVECSPLEVCHAFVSHFPPGQRLFLSYRAFARPLPFRSTSEPLIRADANYFLTSKTGNFSTTMNKSFIDFRNSCPFTWEQACYMISGRKEGKCEYEMMGER